MKLVTLLSAGILLGVVLCGCGSSNTEDTTAPATPAAGGAAAAPGAAATPGTTGGAAAAGKPTGVMTKNAVGLPPTGGESNVGTKTSGG